MTSLLTFIKRKDGLPDKEEIKEFLFKKLEGKKYWNEEEIDPLYEALSKAKHRIPYISVLVSLPSPLRIIIRQNGHTEHGKLLFVEDTVVINTHAFLVKSVLMETTSKRLLNENQNRVR